MMKKILILLGLLFLQLSKSFGQDTIYSYPFTGAGFDFEDRPYNYFYIDSTQSNNIWQIGTPSKAIFDSAYSVPLSLVTDTLNIYPNLNTSSFEFVVYTENQTDIWFVHRFDTDSLSDGGIVELSIDNGFTWTNIMTSTPSNFSFINFYSVSDTLSSFGEQPGFTGNSGEWIYSNITFSIPTSLTYVVYRFRFTFTSDSINTNKDGWIIDNLSFSSYFTGISDIESMPFKIFPNPASDFITIQNSNSLKFISATIKNMFGKTILTSENKNIDVSQFKRGSYLIEINSDKGRHVTKLIIK